MIREICRADDSPTKLGWAVAEESCIETSNSPVLGPAARERSSPTDEGRDSSSKLEMLGGEATDVFRGGQDEPSGICDWVLVSLLLLPSWQSPTATSLLLPTTLWCKSMLGPLCWSPTTILSFLLTWCKPTPPLFPLTFLCRLLPTAVPLVPPWCKVTPLPLLPHPLWCSVTGVTSENHINWNKNTFQILHCQQRKVCTLTVLANIHLTVRLWTSLIFHLCTVNIFFLYLLKLNLYFNFLIPVFMLWNFLTQRIHIEVICIFGKMVVHNTQHSFLYGRAVPTTMKRLRYCRSLTSKCH
jgi:hypothetical protein